MDLLSVWEKFFNILFELKESYTFTRFSTKVDLILLSFSQCFHINTCFRDVFLRETVGSGKKWVNHSIFCSGHFDQGYVTIAAIDIEIRLVLLCWLGCLDYNKSIL